MGCTSGKMVQVAPTVEIQRSDSNNNSQEQLPTKRLNSATSNISKTSKDSAFIEGDRDSIISTESSVRSGGLKRTLRGLSARSKVSVEPLKDETSVLEQLRSEGLLLESDKQKAKSGLSFELFDETSQRRKPPARLAKLLKPQKRKLLTQQDIEAKLQNAEQRRKQAEAERLERIHTESSRSVHNALDSFAEHQKNKQQQVQEKVDTAAENRAKKLKEMREKLRQKEEHATLVRQRRKTIAPIKISEQTVQTREE